MQRGSGTRVVAVRVVHVVGERVDVRKSERALRAEDHRRRHHVSDWRPTEVDRFFVVALRARVVELHRAEPIHNTRR